MVSTIDERATGRGGGPRKRRILRPECRPTSVPSLPNGPSEAGDVKVPVRQMRDPAIFEEGGRTFIFYSICGEQGIAAAELELKN